MSNSQTICIIDVDAVYHYNIMQHAIAKKLLTFTTGTDALYFLEENAQNNAIIPDFIFLHVTLPFVDTWDFMEKYSRIKSIFKKKINIYIVSSSTSDIDLEKAKRFAEISDYIVKPSTASYVDCITFILEKENAIIA
jgi:CheY-like chemotaxis protein